MQLTCPTCGARYRIDASNWPTEPGAEPGPAGEPVFRARRARCKVCRSVWNAVPEEELLELDDPLPPESEPRLGEAAWSSLGGWPDPKPLAPAPAPDFTPPMSQPPPVFQPQRDGDAPYFAPPARPSIHFDAPPVPIPDVPEPRQPVRLRLPGPAAQQDPDEPPPPPEEELWEEEEEESAPRKVWLYGLTIAALALTLLILAFLSGRLRPEDHGLPPLHLPAIALPSVDLPAIRLPRAAPPPLAVEADAVKRRLPDGKTVWEVEGRITNPTKARQPVPQVELVLLDSGGRAVGRWTIRPDVRNLAPAGVARFETSSVDPPASAVRLRVQLKPAELGRL